MQKVLQNSALNLRNIGGNTAPIPYFFLNSVGQSDKSPCPTGKALRNKEKTVGRHQTEKIQKEVKRRLMQLDVFINLVNELAPDIKTKDEYCFVRYNDALTTELGEQDYFLLKRLIDAFAVLNFQNRTFIDENTCEVSEQDYLFAFRLLKWKNKPLKRRLKPEQIKFLDRIEWYFYDDVFTSREIAEKMRISRIYRVRNILKFFIKEGKIERVSSRGYRLITHK